MASPATEVLERIRAERGYTLSYHEIYSRIEPSFLEAYGGLYRACTLDRRFLSPRWRELVWVGLLAAAQEGIGSIHLDRGRDAGVSPHEFSAAIRLAGIAESWDTLAFAHSNWSAYLPDLELAGLYLEQADIARGPLEAEVSDLLLMVVHAIRQRPEPFLLHLRRCYTGVAEEQIAEALSYILQPVGANQLLWATDLWLEALRDGRLEPSPVLGRGNFTTRLG